MDHPEFLTVNGIPYRVERLLGKGKGGYSYLVTGPEGRRCTLKQIHHEPCDYYQFGDKLSSELRDYERLCAVGVPMPVLYAVDHAQERLLKEYIEGDTVYDLVRTGRMDPRYTDQMRQLCRSLYAAGLNIDYFPTNFIPKDGRLFYVDYECNSYMEQWDFEHWGVKYWSGTEEFLAYAKEHDHDVSQAIP